MNEGCNEDWNEDKPECVGGGYKDYQKCPNYQHDPDEYLDEYLEKVIEWNLKNDLLFALDDFIFQLKEEKNKEWKVTKNPEMMGFFEACRIIQDKIDELRQSKNQQS